ncbi:MAG: heme exporter protein CcmD [Alphaproteobacteria bacterium]|nr:MAG: heme exporter protein CcmD [Alphaproteobacteria bacterium]
MEQLAHGPFIWASYGIAAGVFLALGLRSWLRAKALEAEVEKLRAQTAGRRAAAP